MVTIFVGSIVLTTRPASSYFVSVTAPFGSMARLGRFIASCSKRHVWPSGSCIDARLPEAS